MGKKTAKSQPKRARAPKEPPALILKSAAEVAVHFGVSERAVHYWIAAGCPGEPGKFDVDAIAAWRDARKPSEDADDSPRAKYHAARADREVLKLAKERGELVRSDAVRRLFVRHVHEAKAILGQLADRVAALLPGAEAKLRRKAREETTRLVSDACRSLADVLTAEEMGAAAMEET